jgi:hypothetical protein
MRTCSVTMLALLALACDGGPDHEGRFSGRVTGGYAGLGALVDGNATAVQLTFEGDPTVATIVRAGEDELTFEVDGARLPLRARAGAGSATLVTPWSGEPVPIAVGGSIGTVPVTPTEGQAIFGEGNTLRVEMRATAPPREEGAPPASLSWSFDGTRE